MNEKNIHTIAPITVPFSSFSPILFTKAVSMICPIPPTKFAKTKGNAIFKILL